MSKQYYDKFVGNLTESEQEATPDTWVEMYSFDFTGRECYIKQIVVNSNNDHKLKITINDEEIFNFTIKDLEDAFEDVESDVTVD